MKVSDFKIIKYFTAREVRATGAKLKYVDKRVIICLDRVRKHFGIRIKINHLSTGKHAPGSYHYVTEERDCLAVDFKFRPGRGKKMPPKNKVVQVMIDCGFRGIGVYGWGFHGDVRDKCALWKRVRGIYLPLI